MCFGINLSPPTIFLLSMFCNCSQTLTAKMHLMMCGWISNTKSVSMLVVRPQNLSQCGVPISCCHNSVFIVSYDFPSQGFGKTVCVGDSKLWGDRPHHSLWWDLEGTVYRIVGIFWGRKLFHGFVAISRKFSLQNSGAWRPLAWQKWPIHKRFFHQFTKVSPSKVSCYTVHNALLLYTLCIRGMKTAFLAS